VSAALATRAAGLAAATLLAGVFAVAISQASRGGSPSAAPGPVVGAWGGWTAALAGVASSVPAYGRAGDCGWLITRSTQGVIHPVLPCGAKVVVQYRGEQAVTRVVAQSPVGNARQFDLTPKLAKALGLSGIRRVRWAFSR
jgi:hypothetical protein